MKNVIIIHTNKNDSIKRLKSDQSEPRDQIDKIFQICQIFATFIKNETADKQKCRENLYIVDRKLQIEFKQIRQTAENFDRNNKFHS